MKARENQGSKMKKNLSEKRSTTDLRLYRLSIPFSIRLIDDTLIYLYTASRIHTDSCAYNVHAHYCGQQYQFKYK
jgi:hypothetical protein